ncbi:hypothetical protein GGR57DRAFT_508015 [Xylariaceae sp. FL1272]|nr:hypothetical protein GGR57DRAFT_508015 [Xylariaceae sp. FL1272]
MPPTMRTRRQGKAAAAAAAVKKEEEASSSPPLTPPPVVAAVETKPAHVVEDAPLASPPHTVVKIAKIEGPTVTRPTPMPRSWVPKSAQFPLVAILSMIISSIGTSLVWPFTKGVLAAHARPITSWPELVAIIGWRLFELALGWFGDYDGYDITALNLLTHVPPLYLLFAHYDTPALPILLTLAVETISTYIPWHFMRSLSRAHAKPATAPNADILTDTPITLLTTLLAGAIYSVALLFAYATYLPTYLVLYFNDLISVVRAHDTNYIGLLPVTLILGFAARVFIFTPAASAARTEADEKNERFDPARASLKDTVWWNVWGWSTQAKVAIRRTALLCAATALNTFLQTRLTVNGVETRGAAAWSSVWVLASAVTGLALGAVGSV